MKVLSRLSQWCLRKASEVRARQLSITQYLVGIKGQTAALSGVQNQLDTCTPQTAFMGDDLNDLTVRPVVELLYHLPMFIDPSAVPRIQCYSAETAIGPSEN